MREAARMEAQHPGAEVVAAEELPAMQKNDLVDVVVVVEEPNSPLGTMRIEYHRVL
jgi:hypothetical protein